MGTQSSAAGGPSGRFFDGGLPAGPGRDEVPPDPSRPVRVELELTGDRRARFALRRRIAYHDRIRGTILVPRDPETFRTDLTSVPWLFTWLVPRTGAFLPAALVHDGLYSPPDRPDYVVSGPWVDRVEADRVLRDALRDLGTPVLRRWLMWSAVTVATMVRGRDTRWSTGQRWRYRLVALGTVALIAWLGYSATLDLFDLSGPLAPALPWMGDRPWPAELVGGAVGAAVVPLLLALAWGPFRLAGAVIGVGLAFLLHVTLALLVLTGLYRVAEWAATAVADRVSAGRTSPATPRRSDR